MTFPTWLVPLLLALGVIAAGVAAYTVQRRGSARGWAIVAMVCGSAAALVLLLSLAAVE